MKTSSQVLGLNKTLPPSDGEFPDEDEIRASELAFQADQEMMYKLLEADDALRLAVEENKRLNLLIAQWELRMHGLMSEKNECIKMIKQLQKENTRLKTIKQTASHNRGLSTLEKFRGH